MPEIVLTILTATKTKNEEGCREPWGMVNDPDTALGALSVIWHVFIHTLLGSCYDAHFCIITRKPKVGQVRLLLPILYSWELTGRAEGGVQDHLSSNFSTRLYCLPSQEINYN